MDSGNSTLVLCKSSKCAQLLSSFSGLGPGFDYFKNIVYFSLIRGFVLKNLPCTSENECLSAVCCVVFYWYVSLSGL